MPPTTAMSILLGAIKQGLRPASSSCLLRRAAAAQTLQQHRYLGAAATERDVPMSNGPKFAKLSNRSIMRVAGTDAADLIQGLVPNDISEIEKNNSCMYTMFLNSAGRVLYDVMVYHIDEAGTGKPGEQCYLIECDKSVTTDIQRHMVVYRVRKAADVSYFGDQYQVWVAFDLESKEDSHLSFGALGTQNEQVMLKIDDPRVRGFAQRIITKTGAESEAIAESIPDCQECPIDWYTVHRFKWGIPEGVIDLPPAEALPLESNLAFMNGVSFTKGCYLGQELTARTHHTGVIRKRIMPLEITGGEGLLTPGSIITTANGKDAGRARGHLGQYGLGLMRVSVSRNNEELQADLREGHRVHLRCNTPDWWVGKHD